MMFWKMKDLRENSKMAESSKFLVQPTLPYFVPTLSNCLSYRDRATANTEERSDSDGLDSMKAFSKHYATYRE